MSGFEIVGIIGSVASLINLVSLKTISPKLCDSITSLGIIPRLQEVLQDELSYRHEQDRPPTEVLSEYTRITLALVEVIREDSQRGGFKPRWLRLYSSIKPDKFEARLIRLSEDLRRVKLLQERLIHFDPVNPPNKLKPKNSPRIDSVYSPGVSVSYNDESRRLLWWMPDLGYQEKHEALRAERAPFSDHEILRSNDFSAWLKDHTVGKSGCLYCYGVPGVGKTMLASLVIDRLLTTNLGPKTGVAFFYFDHSIEHSVANIAGCLLKQLCLFNREVPLSVQHLQGLSSEDEPQSLFGLVDAITSLDRMEIYIVLDGINEYGWKEPENFEYLLKALRNSPCKLFLTSRRDVRHEKLFSGCRRIQCWADKDLMRTYITAKIADDRRLGFLMNESLQQEIVDEVTEKADDMFLWASFALRVITDQVTRDGVRQVLRDMPKGLDGILRLAVERISAQPIAHRKLAMHTLRILSFARAPLSVQQVCETAAVQYGDSDLDLDNVPAPSAVENVCLGLVKVNMDSQSICLDHYVLQEYLVVLFPNGEYEMAMTCLNYLSFDEFGSGACKTEEQLISRLSSFSFLGYASRYWGDHARPLSDPIVTKLVLAIIKDSLRLAACVQASDYLAGSKSRLLCPELVSGLQIAVRFGLNGIIQQLIEEGADVNECDERGLTPLHEAAQAGYPEIITLLLRHGAKAEALDQRHRSPLYYAAKDGHEDAVKIFNSHMSYTSDSADNLSKSVQVAAENGHAQIILHMLEASSKQISFPLHDALLAAASHGHQEIVAILLDRGAETNAESLRAGVKANHENILNMLLENGAEINMQDFEGRTALHYAAQQGQTLMVKLLLKNGANTEIADRRGHTALSEAVRGGDESSTRLLLERGANLKAVDTSHRQSLHIAVHSRNQAVVERLLRFGADVNWKDYNGWTPLHLAVDEGHQTLIELLIESGSNIHVQVPGKGTALHMAAARGQERTVKTLLDHGADLNEQSIDQGTPLHCAASKGHESIVRILLEFGVDVNAQAKVQCTPLHLAAARGHKVVVDCLLDAGADADARTTGQCTAYDLAAVRKYSEIMSRLMEASSASELPGQEPDRAKAELSAMGLRSRQNSLPKSEAASFRRSLEGA